MITITGSIVYLIIYVFVGIVTFVILRTKLNFHSRGEAQADAYLSLFWIVSIPFIVLIRTILYFRSKKETKLPEYRTPLPPPPIGLRPKPTQKKVFKFGR